jgi:PPM family protein phosphatase
MEKLFIRVGCHTAQGKRPNNEDRFVADAGNKLFLVADGMGGQECGERASELASEIIPRVLKDRLSKEDAERAVQDALDQANQAIINEGQTQAPGRRMGTTAVLAVQKDDLFYVAGLGDSRAYLIRHGRVDQLTVDHTVADALERNGALTPEQAATSPWKHVLYKFLGCVEMTEGAEVRPFMPEPGDRLLLASDGLTNHVTPADLIESAAQHHNPQSWADHLVQLALERGSRDNVTCVIVAFNYESEDSKVIARPPRPAAEPDTGEHPTLKD